MPSAVYMFVCVIGMESIPAVRSTFSTSCCRDPNRKQAKVSAVKDGSGNLVCATEVPDRVEHVESKIQCLSLCLDMTECIGSKWRAPRRCEVYFKHPSNYSIVDGCSYFSPGEEFNNCLALLKSMKNQGFLIKINTQGDYFAPSPISLLISHERLRFSYVFRWILEGYFGEQNFVLGQS